jgi:ubiquinone/menaquinone biosynthesis C-methylase UbiE
MKNDDIYKKAKNTEKVESRSDINIKYGEFDFSAWTKDLIKDLAVNNVLDVCCGTGNQLVLYASIPKVKMLFGVDISKEALKKAEERLRPLLPKNKFILIQSSMEEMFKNPILNSRKYNLISCFYGLYYSKDVTSTLEEMIEHLDKKGNILIVGPFGKNNASLFSLLEKYFKLPELVIRSSSTFMEEEVLPIIKKYCVVTQKYFFNRIKYPNPESLLAYWKSTTFYFPEYENEVFAEIKKHFNFNKEFIVEKHVMAIIGEKK